MKGDRPRKKRPEDIDASTLTEPRLTRDQSDRLTKGIVLFNDQRFWEAHEVWEEIWIEVEEESRIFFQGIIQVAAGYHLLLEKPRPSGALKNFSKALKKLDLFPDRFLTFEVEDIRRRIRKAIEILEQAGTVPSPFPEEGLVHLGSDRRDQ